jgi:hypothetical protein
MRKLLLLPIVILLALLAFSAPSSALTLPETLSAAASEEEGEFEPGELELETEEDELETEEACEFADEEGCDEEAEESEECILEDARAKVAPRPGINSVQLTIRYKAYAPAAVAIDARLRGSKGRLHLGAKHTHFRRGGVFRETFPLGERKMERALGARQFDVEVRALNTPRYCRLDLNGAPRRAKRSLRSDAPGRSGDRGPTRGRSHRAHRR